MRETITFRPETEDDLEFLQKLYASTREEELKQVDWPEEYKAAFLLQQFTAQYAHYRENYLDARYSIILENGLPIGRLYLNRLPKDWRIMDIALIPEVRRRGIGGMLLRELLDQAGAEGKTVSIHVEFNNPALHLYENLGFRQLEAYGPYLLLEWRPDGAPAVS